jgi:hypothetical protein
METGRRKIGEEQRPTSGRTEKEYLRDINSWKMSIFMTLEETRKRGLVFLNSSGKPLPARKTGQDIRVNGVAFVTFQETCRVNY